MLEYSHCTVADVPAKEVGGGEGKGGRKVGDEPEAEKTKSGKAAIKYVRT